MSKEFSVTDFIRRAYSNQIHPEAQLSEGLKKPPDMGPPSCQAVRTSPLKYWVVHRGCELLKSNGFSNLRGKCDISRQLRGESQPPNHDKRKRYKGCGTARGALRKGCCTHTFIES